MSPGRSTLRTIATLAMSGSLLLCTAQVPLVPEWEHTWSFGQDPLPGLIAPPAKDNHVVVDPVTGLVYCTISDEDMLFSPRNELLYSSDPSGVDVTAAPVPVLGKAQFQELYDAPYNAHGTFGFGVYAGQVFATHVFRQGDAWAPYSTGGPIDGSRWSLSQSLPFASPLKSHMAIGADGVLLGTDVRLTCTAAAGWSKWVHTAPGPIKALEIVGDVAWVLSANAVLERLSMLDGALLSTSDVAPGGEFMAVQADHIHQASVVSGGLLTVTKNDLSGALAYSTTHDLGTLGELSGLVVDSEGRSWATYTEQTLEADPVRGILVGFDADGDLIGTYTHGASMNGIDTDGTNVYITGRSSSGGTYLAKLDLALITATPERTSDNRRLKVWPQPTAAEIHVQVDADASYLELIDGAGRTVRTWSKPFPGTRMTLEVSELGQGTYFLRQVTQATTSSTPVVIVR